MIVTMKKERNRKKDEDKEQTHELDAMEMLKAWDTEMVDI